MYYQNRAGANKGSGGVAGASETAVDRRERLRKLALETIDLAKDPYILRTHLGTLECRLCLTLHVNEGSYLAHTQGKKHQTNLARRAAKDNKDQALMIQAPTAAQQVKKKVFVKIGRPGYKIIKIREPVSQRMGLLFTVSLPEIKAGERPRRRFMSAFEQRREIPNKAFQYLVLAAEPYETIAFAIPSKEMVDVDEDPESTWEHWDADERVYSCQFLYK
ncbi:splicing factor 3A subunit 2 [Cryptococcus deuterogattii 99/473]|uniref:Unplaced genomic scaffold supercont1.2, whole genome shotgun sequence n=2 Tax=Cryptococcus gattii species complex TaxID=1884637 RepID=A0A0D0V889_9TREE|nr:splicing factor 3A subunit 2 [Cryptococcus deuterogattii LA55]KIR36299.1 splicing factor 3A subunit 2 [Cryptococcus deuterogattii MMRL2647]KIR42744.1 splicing factor 3A subunit 2 [Cryptococcus deuterogattii Ram5]KIR68473.1 splicing factor 3A subunit 2 [Cryptococcus bacillisporus CA1873]KIR75731.1 splicing factor 3A subunit 2 [Cryptococcus deuterogattii CA1014]KIR89440.1 splicing factor 3A subunit 2 [Cryptococcus tetragattii IND107]KIR95672.1 splicing factor 3A subunit 2 [Cryptococcus deute|eukprot:KIR68473.1 splicing factor 3A subunit 2 [Cryptococcus gattii CA1873]